MTGRQPDTRLLQYHGAGFPRIRLTVARAFPDRPFEDLRARRDQQVPMGTMGDGWDVAHAVVFLASDEARYITGTELVIDGGLSLTMNGG